MTYSPTDRLHRRFHSPVSLGTTYRVLITFGVFTPPLRFRGGLGNPKTVDVMAYKPDFHTHKPGKESCATIVGIIIVSYIGYGYGKNFSFSCSIDSARARQTGKLCKSAGHFVRRGNSGLYQKPSEFAYFEDIESHSIGLRSPCIPTPIRKGGMGLTAPQTPQKLKLLGVS